MCVQSARRTRTVLLQQQLAASSTTGVQGRALQRINRHEPLWPGGLLHLLCLEAGGLCQAGLCAVPCTCRATRSRHMQKTAA